MSSEKFREKIQAGYAFKGACITLGGAVYNNEVQSGVLVSAALRTINRHGLIAGATGTGKTKTIQKLTEALSDNGISVLMMDIKGDFSGVSQAGAMNERIKERHDKLGIAWNAQQYPVEFLTISKENGVRMRATVSEFGPVLFSKVLGLNDTQAGIVSIIFKYCDDNKLPLLDLKDFKKVVNFITNEGKDEITKNYGNIATQSAGTILRNLLMLEQQGAEFFFGEKSFEVDDLCRINEQGQGMINILRLNDIPDKPQLFSTFMLSLLAEIYATFPEEGDVDAPKLVFFIDEAHLIFNEASKALLQQLESIIKLIRSKGIGIVFCTQNPIDIPQSILAQLGFKIQHALRAFTANDRKAIKQCAQNYPETEFYKTEDLLTQLGIGEALITVLDERGAPTPLVHTMLCAPASRMDTISQAELDLIVSKSQLAKKYNELVDRESAFEMLTKKIEMAAEQEETSTTSAPTSAKASAKKEEEGGVLDTIGDMANSSVGKVIMREVTRGLLGVLGLGGSTRRKTTRSRGLFG